MKYFLIALMLLAPVQFAHAARMFFENIVPEDGYAGGPQQLRCPDGRFVLVPGKRWDEITKDGKMCWPKSVSEKWTCADYIENARAMGCIAGGAELVAAVEGVLEYLGPVAGPAYPTAELLPGDRETFWRKQSERKGDAVWRLREALIRVKNEKAVPDATCAPK